MSSPVRYALLNPLRRKERTAFSVVGIVVSVALVVAVVSATRGLHIGLSTMLKEYRGDLIVIRQGSEQIPASELPPDLSPLFEGLDEVADVNPYSVILQGISFVGVPEERRREMGVPPTGVLAFPLDAFVFDKLEPALDRHGEPLGRAHFSAPDANEMLIGRGVYEAMQHGLTALERQAEGTTLARMLESYLDETFSLPRPKLIETEFEIVGVFQTDTVMDMQVVVPLEAYQRLFETDRVSAYLIVAEPGTDLEALGETIRSLPESPVPLDVLDPTRLSDRFNRQLERANALIWFITFIAGFVGSLFVLVTMVTNVHERTREIGLLQAVGWKRSQILRAILMEGLALSAVAGVLGVAAGYGLLVVAELYFGVDPIPEGFEWHIGLIGMAMALALGLLGSLLPAWRAARLSPVEALRNE